MDNKVKCEIGDQTFFLSPEEYEDLLVSLYEKGYYISKFDMKFYEQDSAGEFAEEVKMVDNPKFPEYNGIRGYRGERSTIVDFFDITSIDPNIMEEVINGFYIKGT